MPRLMFGLGLVVPACLFAGLGRAGDATPPDPAREVPTFAATQVSLAIDRGGLRQRFRGTVLAIREDVLTVLAAAHFFREADEGRPARLFVDEEDEVGGTMLSVALNPAFRPKGSRDVAPGLATKAGPGAFSPMGAPGYLRRSGRGFHGYVTPHALPSSTLLNRELPGADNAIVRLRFPSRDGQGRGGLDPALLAIRPAPSIVESTCPGASGGSLTARMLDEARKEHAIRAGNFQNPRLLEWGHGYDPRRDATGGGVFRDRPGADGRVEATLIGVLLGPDERGGSASLVALEMPWIAEALREDDGKPSVEVAPPLKTAAPSR